MDSSITIRIDSETKTKMAEICRQLGMTTSTAFNLFANAFVREKGMPFPVTVQQPHVRYPKDEEVYRVADKILDDYIEEYKRLAE